MPLVTNARLLRRVAGLRLVCVEAGLVRAGYIAGVDAGRRTRAKRVIGAIVGGGLILLGVAEFVVRLDEPGPLLFWLPTLWGGGGLVLLGVFGNGGSARRSVGLVTLGALLGFLPTIWTVVIPILSMVLVVLVLQESRATSTVVQDL